MLKFRHSKPPSTASAGPCSPATDLGTGHPRTSGNLRKGQLAANTSCKAIFLHNTEVCPSFSSTCSKSGHSLLTYNRFRWKLTFIKLHIWNKYYKNGWNYRQIMWHPGRIYFIFKIESCATTSSVHDLMEILMSLHTKLGQWFAVPTVILPRHFYHRMLCFRVLVYVYLTRPRKTTIS